ncbi:MAG: DUF177 domain-containing protein [Mariprofundaceae bacterium]
MHKQFVIHLMELAATGWQWSGELSKELVASDAEGDIEPFTALLADVRWNVDIHRENSAFYLEGGWSTLLQRNCTRCSGSFSQRISGEHDRTFAIGNEAESDDVELLAAPGRVNLIDLLREDMWLARSIFAVCQPDCKGLCNQCGQNLNDKKCQCGQEKKPHPFDKLHALKLRG